MPDWLQIIFTLFIVFSLFIIVGVLSDIRSSLQKVEEQVNSLGKMSSNKK